MPFSTTESATEAEWTSIFEGLIKPAVEGSGFGYECRRSSATRGNVVRGVVEDLRAAHLVVADLTDRNADVFYELGVRHALSDRTILLSQHRDHIPFDLRGYANHVYDWRSETGKGAFLLRIRELLSDVDSAPHRPDNPVSDFLGGQLAPSASTLDERLVAIEEKIGVVIGQMEGVGAVGVHSGGLDSETFEFLANGSLLTRPATVKVDNIVAALSRPEMSGRLLGLTRRTLADVKAQLGEVVATLNQPNRGSVQRDKIAAEAAPFVEQVSMPLG